MKRRGLALRLLATHLSVAVAVLAAGGFFVGNLVERRALDSLEQRLASEARAVRAVMRERVDQQRIVDLGRASGSRLTIIRRDGVVVADSERDPATMENHAGRPEVAAAIAGRIGSEQRVSETVGRQFLYVATPVQDGLVVRAALPADDVAAEQNSLRTAILVGLLGSVGLAGILSAIAAASVSRPLRTMSEEVARVAEGSLPTVQAVGPRETRVLADAVNQMAAELAERMRKVSEEATLRDQILSAMGEGVILHEGSDVVYANQAAQRIIGVDAQRPTPSALIDAGPGTREISLHHPTRRDVQVITIPLDGSRLVSVVRDVTQAKRIEQTRRDFVADASHEMKTPVAGILATAETLRRTVRDDPDRSERFVETLVDEGRRLSQLIGDLLSLARLEEPLASGQEHVDLSDLVEREVERARVRCTEKGLRLETAIDPGVSVVGRGEDIAQMLANLLDNAIRHTSGGGISVALRRGDRVHLTVSDTGEGIPSKDLARVFERFFRVDPARARATGGTGLGLAIVRHVVENHGGRVEAHSELGKGSTFEVSLPAG